jgi:hypothetical protein
VAVWPSHSIPKHVAYLPRIVESNPTAFYHSRRYSRHPNHFGEQLWYEYFFLLSLLLLVTLLPIADHFIFVLIIVLMTTLAGGSDSRSSRWGKGSGGPSRGWRSTTLWTLE